MKSICLDIGHMNTTGAFPTALPDGSYKIERLAFEDKDQVLNSQIILMNDQMERLRDHKSPTYDFLRSLGPIEIGNKLSAYPKGGEKFSYFKAAPKYFEESYGSSECARRSGITRGQLMSCYVYALMEAIFKYNSDDWNENERSQIELVIGCPSTQDWVAPSEREKYANLVQQATKVKFVRIVPESRGAMFSGVEKKKEVFSAMDGAAVFDFGSSTADFTYMLMGRKIIEFSWTLGAGKIEEQMAMEAYRELVRQKGSFVADEESMSIAVDLMRPAKEAYYDNIYGEEGQSIVCKFREYDTGADSQKPAGKSRKVLIDVDDEFMDRITGDNQISVICDSHDEVQGSWQSLCRSFYQTAKNAIDTSEYIGTDEKGNIVRRRCEVHSIILTGGASRMPFIAALSREVFPDKGIRIFLEENPSHTVSNGLAWVAVSDARLEDCKKAALEIVNANEACRPETLNKRLSDSVFAVISDVIVSQTNEWAQQPDDSSVKALQNSLEQTIDGPEMQKRLENTCAAEILAWKERLSAEMEEAINAQTGKLFTGTIAQGVAIPKDVWQELQAGSLDMEGLNVSQILTNLDLNDFTRKLGKVIVQIAMWTAALGAALAAGAVGVIVALLVGFFVTAVIDDSDMDKPRSQKIRKSVAKKMAGTVKKSRSDIMKDFEEGLDRQTQQYAAMIEQTITAALEIATLRRFETESAPHTEQ